MNGFTERIEQLHTTEMGAQRIKRNLQIEPEDVVQWCRERISREDARWEQIGKNLYVTAGDCKITINAHSNTIITAHRIKGSRIGTAMPCMAGIPDGTIN